MNPLISIIIPTYNRAKDIKRALSSVLAQTYVCWEVLVVDNHSTDATDEVIDGFADPRIKLFKVHNQGVIAISRNLGLRHAAGEYVAFLDSDDWWLPSKLQESIDVLEQDIDLIYHDLFLVDHHGQRNFRKKTDFTRDLNSPVFDDLLVNCNAIPTSSVVVRKRLLQAVGGMAEDADLVSAEDYDTWLRVAKLTERFRRIPETLGYYWRGGGNTMSIDRSIKSLAQIKARHEAAFLRSSIIPRLWWYDFSMGRMYFKKGLYSVADNHFKKVELLRVPVRIALRTIFMLVFIVLTPIFKRSVLSQLLNRRR